MKFLLITFAVTILGQETDYESDYADFLRELEEAEQAELAKVRSGIK